MDGGQTARCESDPHVEHLQRVETESRGSHGKRVRSFDELFTETAPPIATSNLVQ
jgi:hypothetical protein